MQKGEVKLNPQQRQAVATFVTVAAGRTPVAIFGPPGTGKTVTVVEAALQALAGEGAPCSTLLVCAPQNFACDTLCTRLLAAKVPPADMLRLIDPRLPVKRVVRPHSVRFGTVLHFARCKATQALMQSPWDPCALAPLRTRPGHAFRAGTLT